MDNIPDKPLQVDRPNLIEGASISNPNVQPGHTIFERQAEPSLEGQRQLNQVIADGKIANPTLNLTQGGERAQTDISSLIDESGRTVARP